MHWAAHNYRSGPTPTGQPAIVPPRMPSASQDSERSSATIPSNANSRPSSGSEQEARGTGKREESGEKSGSTGRTARAEQSQDDPTEASRCLADRQAILAEGVGRDGQVDADQYRGRHDDGPSNGRVPDPDDGIQSDEERDLALATRR